MPDTSPRGIDVPDDRSYDLGQGASFYVDATQEPWATHYKMFSYVTEELPGAIQQVCPYDGKRQGIFGHSMGGHGALIAALKTQNQYLSLSAIAPISTPSRSPWEQKACNAYLGDSLDVWAAYDATELIQDGCWEGTILLDQGQNDEYLEKELKPDLFVKACQKAEVSLTYRLQPRHDHSYYFVASVVGDHIAHHAKILKA
jgi:S-formylglutathione hydrolase